MTNEIVGKATAIIFLNQQWISHLAEKISEAGLMDETLLSFVQNAKKENRQAFNEINKLGQVQDKTEIADLRAQLHEIAFFSHRIDGRLSVEYENGWNDAVTEITRKAMEHFTARGIDADTDLGRDKEIADLRAKLAAAEQGIAEAINAFIAKQHQRHKSPGLPKAVAISFSPEGLVIDVDGEPLLADWRYLANLIIGDQWREVVKDEFGLISRATVTEKLAALRAEWQSIEKQYSFAFDKEGKRQEIALRIADLDTTIAALNLESEETK